MRIGRLFFSASQKNTKEIKKKTTFPLALFREKVV